MVEGRLYRTEVGSGVSVLVSSVHAAGVGLAVSKAVSCFSRLGEDCMCYSCASTIVLSRCMQKGGCSRRDRA